MNNKEIDELLKGNAEGKIHLLDEEITIFESLKNGQSTSVKFYEWMVNDHLKNLRNVNALEQKLDKEFEEYCNSLKNKTPSEIIDSAYEITVKQEMKDYLKNMALFPKELRILLEQNNILTEFYHDWLNVDTPLGESLESSVGESISMITRYYDKNKKIKKNKNIENER